jgi:ATP-binding cassette, subfamily C (CFTR/MRP), member 1
MKVIKLYAWEQPFLEKITAVRELELATLKKIGYLAATQSFTWACTPFLVSFSTFAFYSFTNAEPLTSTKVFVALSLFNLLQFPLAVFPNVITATIEASVSFSRLYKFLMSPELDDSAVKKELVPPLSDPSKVIERVVISEGSFGWNEGGTPVINGISFSLPDAALLAVVGQVGSGKSTLLSAILGDTYKLAGSVCVRGSVAYVPQSAWIMNATLRDNVSSSN